MKLLGDMIQDVRASKSKATCLANGSRGTSQTDDLSEFECFSEEMENGEQAASEIDVYLGYNPPKRGFDLLDFWKSQCSTLPKLSALAQKVLGAPACLRKS